MQTKERDILNVRNKNFIVLHRLVDLYDRKNQCICISLKSIKN